MFLIQKSLLRQYLAAFISSLSIFCGGSAYTWITPLLFQLKKPDSIIPLTNSESSWAVALIEVGNLFTPIPAGFLVDLWGRKLILWITGPIYVFTWILALCLKDVVILYVIRTIQGMAMSIQFTVLPMYLGEIAGTKLRGALSAFFQGMWYLGILYEYAFGAYFGYDGLTWVSLAPPAIFTILFLWCPESPQYLLMRGKEQKAAKALGWLRGKSSTDREVAEELKMMQDAVKEEKDNKGSWRDIISTREGRKSLLLVQAVAVTEIMSGLTTLLVYVTDTFSQTSGNEQLASLFTVGLGALLFLVTVGTGFLVDRLGRRPILLISTFGSSVALLAAAIYYALDPVFQIKPLDYLNWIPYVSVIVFMSLISFGVGAILPTIQSEFFPNSTRGIASGITIFNLTVLSFICLKMYQVIEDWAGLYVNFTIFFLFTLLGGINIYLYLPETKGKTFAEIQKLM